MTASRIAIKSPITPPNRNQKALNMKTAKSKTYILRTCTADMTSRDGFKWPKRGVVAAPDWEPIAECGHGLHGFLMGEGNGSLASFDPSAKWLVAEVDEYIDLGGKVKFPRARVIYAGDRKTATDKIVALGATGAVIGRMVVSDQKISVLGGDGSTLTGGDGSTLTGGDGSTLTGGDGSTLTGGYCSTLTGGHCSTLTGGDLSTLTGGDRSTLTGGDLSTLTGGDRSTLTGGYHSTLTGGDLSTLTGGDCSTLTWRVWDGSRYRLHTVYVGENGILPNTPYRWKSGKAVTI